MSYVYEPSVFFGEEGQTALRGRCNVHKVDVAYTVVNYTVDIEGEEHYNEQEFKTVRVVGKLEFKIFTDHKAY